MRRAQSPASSISGPIFNAHEWVRCRSMALFLGNEVLWNEVQLFERENFSAQEEKINAVFDNLTQLVHTNLVKFHKYWTDAKSEKPNIVIITEYMSSCIKINSTLYVELEVYEMDQRPSAVVEEEQVVPSSGRTVSKSERIAALARQLIPTWIEEGKIQKPPMELTDETYQPIKPKAKFQFCIVCGKHSRFDLRGHLKYCHKDFKEDEVEVVMHMSKGILERVKGTKMDFSRVPEPVSERDWDTYKFIMQQLRNSGVPIYAAYEREAMREHCCMAANAHRQYIEQHTNQPGPSLQNVALSRTTTDDVPQTYTSPYICREYQYLITHDELYTGGMHIHPHFLAQHRREKMFDHCNDGFLPGYFIQTRTVPKKPEWQRYADASMKLWRKLICEQHPILEKYRKDLIDKSILIGVEEIDNAKRDAENRSSYVNRFMLVAMRGRGRCGRTVTIDDAIFSHFMVPDFLDMTKKGKVSVKVRWNFAKALNHFYKFLYRQIDANAGERRLPILKKGLSDLKFYIRELSAEDKAIQSYKRSIARQQPDKDEPLYGEMRAVVEHSAIDSKIEEIMRSFAKSQFSLSHVDYNFVMSALILYIMVCNATRNEIAYKTICGSMAEVENRSTGIVKYTHDPKNAPEDYWIVHFPNPKQLKVAHAQTTCKSGLFVLDSKSYRWLQHYRKLRDFIVNKWHVYYMNHQTAPFFLLWKGTPLKSPSVTLMKFLTAVNCDGMNISCNGVRHRTSTLEHGLRQDRTERGSLAVEPPSKSMAALLGHSQNIQSQHYVDNYERTIVRAYRLLKRLAARDAQLHNSEVAAVKKRVNTKGLNSMAEGLSDVEAEENIVRESSEAESDPQSEDELGDEEYVPSKPTQGKASARKSPRKKTRTSSPQRSCSSEDSNEESPVMRRRQLLNKIKAKTMTFSNASRSGKLLNDDDSAGEERGWRAQRRIEAAVDNPPRSSAPSLQPPAATVMPMKTTVTRIPRLFKPRGCNRRHAAPLSQKAVIAAEETTTPSSTSDPLQGSPYEFTPEDAMGSHHAPHSREQQVVQNRLSCLMEHSSADALSLTAEKLLLWVGKQSRTDCCLQLDTSVEMDSFEAYAKSSFELCPETAETVHPCLAPEGASELNKLLHIAIHYAYRDGQSVVLVLKSKDQPFATVVLLGEQLMSPGTSQRYNSCVGYIDESNGGHCYPVRFCPTDTPAPTLSEKFSDAYLLQFALSEANHKILVPMCRNYRLELPDLLRELHICHAGRKPEDNYASR
ncbi:hypothetical protein GCK32_004736 [Trichostrongylus colubriformis]|uniref:Uncharacterized protein n=1 Tax=Trichostrongylus colubriformis TaxID=6319 RepID=A0AAN8G784_TRICO